MTPPRPPASEDATQPAGSRVAPRNPTTTKPATMRSSETTGVAVGSGVPDAAGSVDGLWPGVPGAPVEPGRVVGRPEGVGDGGTDAGDCPQAARIAASPATPEPASRARLESRGGSGLGRGGGCTAPLYARPRRAAVRRRCLSPTTEGSCLLTHTYLDNTIVRVLA